MSLNKALSIFVCAILLLSAILLVEPVKAQPAESISLVSFTLYGWVWSSDYAQYGIGNVTLRVTNGSIIYDTESPETWVFYFPNSQLNFTIQPEVTQTYNISLEGSKTGTIMQLGELNYPTRSDFSGVWLDSNYIWIEGHISGISGASTYYFVIRTRNIDIPMTEYSSDNSFAVNVDSLINNAFKIMEEVNNLMYQLRSGLSEMLYKIVVIYNGVVSQLFP